MLERQLLLLMASQKVGCLEHILDLSTIQLQTSQRCDLLITDLMRCTTLHLCIEADGAAQESPPHRLPGGLVEGGEDGHDAVALDVMGRASLKEHVAFVEKEHGVPVGHHFKNTAKRHLHLLSHRLSSQCLTDTRPTGQEHDDTLTLARDDVVEDILVLDLALGKSEDKLLLVLRKNEGVEGLVVELDLGHVVNVKLHPSLVLESIASHDGGGHDELLLRQWSPLALINDIVIIRVHNRDIIVKVFDIDEVIGVALLPIRSVDDNARVDSLFS
ncbi:hypothetical protein HG530_008735 [Fusarium avenaceum]|nr:hypothetical protein HG530_008735 [Fusarium avenaceum]